MLLKEIDDKCGDIDQLRLLLERPGLSQRQRTGIEREISNIRTGASGEKSSAYFIDEGIGRSPNSILIHDLRLELGDRSAQIDHLVVTKWRRAYVLETKNLNANLTCNADGEWTAWYGTGRRGTPVPIASPIEQARRHAAFLDDWLRHSGLTAINVIEPVIIVGSKNYVNKKRGDGDSSVPVLRADMFLRWWENQRATGGENPIGLLWALATGFTHEDMLAIGKHLVDSHRPIQFDWESRFGIPQVVSAGPRPGSVEPTLASSVTLADVEPGLAAVPAARAGSVPIIVAVPVETPAVLLLSEDVETFAESVGTSSALSSELIVPSEITTTLGAVSIKRVADGRYALRHGTDAVLAATVEASARPFGQWQPRFRNWLIPQANIGAVVEALRGV